MPGILSGIAAGLTIAALFRTTLEIISLIETGRNREPDYQKLRLRLRIEKCRLYAWGKSMGLTDVMETGQDRPIDNLRFPEAVRDILIDVIQLFDNAERVKHKYGVREAAVEDLSSDVDRFNPVRPLSALTVDSSMTTPDISLATWVKRNVVWIAYDRWRFTTLVAEIKDLIDRLKEITGSSGLVDRETKTAKTTVLKEIDEAPDWVVIDDGTGYRADTKILLQTGTASRSSDQPVLNAWPPQPRRSPYGNPRL